ncbi:copper resistance protein CopC [Vibrio sp. 1-Bac 57]
MKVFKTLTILSLVLLSSLVSAHSGLKVSTPENGAMLDKSPEKVMLEFKTPIMLVKLQLIGKSGKSGKPIKLIKSPSKTYNKIFNVELPELDMGSYKIKWVVMGKDAHKMKGDFTFMVHASDMDKMPVNSDGHAHKHN